MVGAVSYGLPCSALSCHTFQSEITRRHIEIMNASLLSHYEMPSHISDNDLANLGDALSKKDISEIYDIVKGRMDN